MMEQGAGPGRLMGSGVRFLITVAIVRWGFVSQVQ